MDSLPAKRGNASGGALVGGALFLIAQMSQNSIDDILVLDTRDAIVEGCSVQYDSREGDIIYCVLPLFNTAAWITSIFRYRTNKRPVESRFPH